MKAYINKLMKNLLQLGGRKLFIDFTKPQRYINAQTLLKCLQDY